MTIEIQQKPITFEQAKFLNDKVLNGKIESDIRYDSIGFIFHSKDYHPNGGKFIGSIFAPEQWKVVEWLRLNHDIWISCYPTSNPKKCQFRIYQNDDEVMGQICDEYMDTEFKTPQEAYSAAFDYIFNKNLI
jgi:hypothetical protein